MKTTIFLIGIILLFACGNVSSQEVVENKTTSQQGEVLISCTPDLFPLTSKWASEFGEINPELKIKVIKNAGTNAVLGVGENLGFISNKSRAAINNETNWKMVVGRDVVVPVINGGNPYLNELLKHGISQELFAQVFNNPDKQNWGTVLGDGQSTPMHIYVINDESVKEAVAKYQNIVGLKEYEMDVYSEIILSTLKNNMAFKQAGARCIGPIVRGYFEERMFDG